jgi:polyvinyl alcohol dehydrogenase (cytochrome)
VWKRRVDDFLGATITGAPTLADGNLYVVTSSAEEVLGANPKYECCKFRGSVSALNAETGEVRWKSYTIPEEPKPVRKNKIGVQLWGPSGAGVWSSPAVDLKRGVVYVTTGDSYSDPAASTSDAFVAFDLKTGKLLWSRQTTAGDAFTIDCGLPEAMRTNCPEANGPDFDFGSSPILVDLPNGRRALIAGQKSGVVHAVDPDRDGAILWQTRVGKGTALGGVQWGSAYDGTRVYVALSDVQPEVAQPGTPGGQPTVFGPQMRLNAQAGGGLFALNPATGATIWTRPHPGCGGRPGCSPAQSAAVTAIPGVVFSGGLDGHLRAYASEDGAIIWDMDTVQAYKTVNGVAANGGSLDGPGPVVVGGTVFVNSGYAFVGGIPGNVLLAFSVDGR